MKITDTILKALALDFLGCSGGSLCVDTHNIYTFVMLLQIVYLDCYNKNRATKTEAALAFADW